jgi:hypothetical protein
MPPGRSGGGGKRGGGVHAFRSKAQWRWAFATHKSWARRWADTNKAIKPYRTLPKRKGVRKKA